MKEAVRDRPSERHRGELELLLDAVSAYNADVDRDLLERAFAFAADHHEGQYRRSGEDFVLHPLGVAQILTGLQVDDATLAAALIHDVVEDTAVSIEQVREEFGDEIARLVEGTTKLTRISFQSRE